MRRWNFWKLPAPSRQVGREHSPVETPDSGLSVQAMVQTAGRDSLTDLADPYYMAREVRVSMQLDDASAVPVAINEQNAAVIVEATQRVREYRERERASLPPVYNFGESAWSGGEG